jgi:hypothetical protein
MKRLLLVISIVFSFAACPEPSQLEKCEIITDEVCIVLDKCLDLDRNECDVFHDEEYCESIIVGDEWERCFDDLYNATCEDDYPPQSCNDSIRLRGSL